MINVQYGNLAPFHVFPLGLVVAHRGDLGRARELADLACELADREGAHLGGLEAIKGVVEHWSGDASAAADWFAKGEAAADAAGPGEPNLRWWRADYAEALIALGRPGRGRGAAGRMGVGRRACRPRLGARADRTLPRAARSGAGKRGAGHAGARRTRLPSTRRSATRSAGRGRSSPSASSGGALARSAQAREAIEAAIDAFETLGAVGWAETARAELGQIGGRTRARGADGRPSGASRPSSPRGETNREVAAALFLARSTVASHLSRVYAKLGVLPPARARSSRANFRRSDVSNVGAPAEFRRHAELPRRNLSRPRRRLWARRVRAAGMLGRRGADASRERASASTAPSTFPRTRSASSSSMRRRARTPRSPRSGPGSTRIRVVEAISSGEEYRS